MNNIKLFREQEGMTQAQLGRLLNVKDAAISKYESGKVPLTGETLLKLSKIFNVSVDDLLGNDNGIKSTFGYIGEDEDAVSFPHKLANQIELQGTKIQDLANGIGVDEKTILDWLSGSNTGYEKYYQKLSDFFKVQVRYWTSPHAISPGIEPSMDEYMLILLYREYKETGILNEMYGSLENFFPGARLIKDSYSQKMLSAFEMLNEDNKDIIIGETKKYLKEQRYEESVAADEQLKEAK